MKRMMVSLEEPVAEKVSAEAERRGLDTAALARSILNAWVYGDAPPMRLLPIQAGAADESLS